MAISVSQTIKELAVMANKLGVHDQVVPSGKNGRIMKEDYIWPIRNHFITERYGVLEKAPNHFQWILSMKSPMLALRIDSLKEDLQKEIWESNDWYLEEKLNGARILIVKDNTGLYLYSRHNSDVDLLPINYTGTIVYPDDFDLDQIPDTFILDTELTSDAQKLNTVIGKYGVTTETQLQAVTALLGSDPKRAQLIQKQENVYLTFNVFDCIYLNGTWMQNEPLKVRRNAALTMWKKLEAAGFKMRPVRSNISNKRQFYKGIILAGGEGCVAKDVNSLYVPDTNRNKDGWIKIKRSMSEMASEYDFGDTIDAWISGFEMATEGKNREGLIGNIIASIYVEKDDGSRYEHEIAKISGIDMKLREDMTDIVNGVPTLKASYYNRVIEIDGAGVSPRVMRLNHAVIKGFRYEKVRDDCVLKESFLQKMVL